MAVTLSELDGQKASADSRLAGIDAFRFIAFVAVVVIHTVPQYAGAIDANSLARHICRFAVPLYFLVSGYFFGHVSENLPGKLRKAVFRIIPAYIVWLTIYTVFFPESWGIFADNYKIVYHLINGGGPGFHLWFLPTLVSCLAAYVLLRPLGFPVIFGIATILFVTGLIFGPYREILDLPHIRLKWLYWNTRNGPFFGLFFIVAGAFIAKRSLNIGFKAGTLLALAGLGLQIFESYMLRVYADGNFLAVDFTIGTAVYGIGVLFMALGWTKLFPPHLVLQAGRLNLWMYGIHMLFIYALLPVLDPHNDIRLLILIGCTVGFSALSAYAAARIKGLKFMM